MVKAKTPKAIKCFANSKDNKKKRQQEQAMANAVRSYRHMNAKDDHDAMLYARQQQQQQQQQIQQQAVRGRSMHQRPPPQYYDYNHYKAQYQPPQHKPPTSAFRPTKVAVHHAHQQPQQIHYLLDVQNHLSGFGRSKSVPPKLKEHFAVYNMYGNDTEEEKIMEFSTDNSITSSKRSLTKGISIGSSQQTSQEHKEEEEEEEKQQEQQRVVRLQQEEQRRQAEQQWQEQQQKRRHEQQQKRLAEEKYQLFQARIQQIQNDLQSPPVPQISISPSLQPPPQQIQQQQQQRSKTPEPMRQRLLQKINPRSKTPEPQRSSPSIIRTQRYHAEKIVTTDGQIMLKKKIVHVNRTRSCAACGFRDWSEDDVAFLLVRRTQENAPQPQQKQQVKWLCPDCASDNGLPKEHYHWNKNRLAPVPDPVIDITMNRPLGQIDPEDLAWVQQAQRKLKPMNWKSQYNEYYQNIRREQRKKEMCCNTIPPPEEYSDDPEDDIRRVIANACYAPNYETSDVGETCYSYVGDL